ncbi:MAG TPA: biosynthetic peptidoglycan transglycosylase [Kofleriaceae bacterium]
MVPAGLSSAERRVLIATAVCALGVPATAAAWVGARTDAVADRLSARAGLAATIGEVDADLTGTVRMSDVALGALVSAGSIEASVGLDSLLAGSLRADELRVAAPRISATVEPDGDSDLARVVRTLSRPRAGNEAGNEVGNDGGGVRRIVVSSGRLAVKIAGLGEVSADAVELVPDGRGVRVITGPVRVAGRAGPIDVELAFARGAAELSLPRLRLGRLLAVGGRGAIGAVGAPPAQLRELSVGRLAPGSIEVRAQLDDAGIRRPLVIEVDPRGQAIAIQGDHLPLAAFAGLAPRGLELAGARASGALAAHRDGGKLVVDVDGALDGAAIDHRVLAASTVPLAGHVRGQLAISAEAITVPRAAIELGAARWTASGWWRRGQPASGQIDLALAPAACTDLLAALPVELRGPLDGIILGGALGGHVRLAVDLAAPEGDGVSLDASITDGCRSEAEPPAADVGRLARTGDQGFADGSHARIGPGEPGYLALAQVPPHVPAAFVSAEDARFYDHAGFDMTQIARSLEIDLREHRLARGGSTISQQLVKNAFLSQRRSFDRKLQEAILTWRLEAKLDKPQILERYLNLIELGPHVFGVTAAARYWFDTTPRELTVRQAAFLAALTSEPSSMSRRVRRARGLDPDSAARLDTVLRAMHRDRRIDAAQVEAAKTQPLRF